MGVATLFTEALVLTDVKANDINELFDSVGSFLFGKGLVTEQYCQELKKREGLFPTGLITQFINIALPHTDSEYINQPFICVVQTNQNLEVLQMGDNQAIQVAHFFFLGIREQEGYSQVELLSKLMELFADEYFVNEYKKADCATKIVKVIQKYLKEEE